ncbi:MULTISPECIES: bifunctional diguanylate cyclase/phosphodiesterase [Lysinibacillus]|uniref:Bifunctional diguanylate cyclase/phosphodiesterase n=1 Tax=Lysinibacillus antri TaxID=2498145 RepID=A0A432LC26_9BACI|nr:MULTISPECIES: bifunctional diguanylate cyclase/phosphodiesterase [Lysinibacillus]RUL52052.1 bifunctional diguanylate cyclase/phosphodiesterase [Lysinibacillus antri]TSI05985.1 EAL domain-containing protein [Lysinibacillus sp. BW-2-10]
MSREKEIFKIDKELVTFAPFPTFLLNRNGHVAIWNDLCVKYFGYSLNELTTSKNTNINTTLFSTFTEESWNRILLGKEPFRFEHIQLVTKNDSFVSATLLTMPCFLDGVPSILVTCLLDDLVIRMDDTSQELIDLKNGLYSTFMVVTLDAEGFITHSNQAFLKASHWTPKRILGKTFWQLFPETVESAEIVETIWQTINSGQIWEGDVEKVTKDGQSYWVHLTAIPTYSQSEQNYHYILIEKDITNEKKLKQQLEKIAYIDTETGLMNVHRLENIVSEMIEEGRHFSFVYLSIDKFYTLKELHNDHLENNLIIEFTKRMKIYFQDSDMARINENDFVVITPLGEWFIQGFLTYLKQNPIYIGNMAVPISISGGITRSPQDQSNFSQLMNASIATIANVREAGGDSILSLSNATHKALNRRSIIEKRLLLALDQQHLKVLYQPQIDLQTGNIIAVEALVRWEDDEVGVVSPDELIPIAEESGLINNIGSFMIEEACKQAAEWQKEGLNLKVSINLSVREFRDKNMAKSILSILARTGCPANLIQIEITEKFALEAEAETSIIKQMRKLENEGIVFVLDDFGTGYASFRYMQLLPIEILKIDQMFISSLLQSEKTQRLIHGMVQFGKSMNLTVLAEGVETKEQRQLLEQYGCDAIQGFLISKPVSELEISSLVATV